MFELFILFLFVVYVAFCIIDTPQDNIFDRKFKCC